jgi:hypothetical protein
VLWLVRGVLHSSWTGEEPVNCCAGVAGLETLAETLGLLWSDWWEPTLSYRPSLRSSSVQYTSTPLLTLLLQGGNCRLRGTVPMHNRDPDRDRFPAAVVYDRMYLVKGVDEGRYLRFPRPREYLQLSLYLPKFRLVCKSAGTNARPAVEAGRGNDVLYMCNSEGERFVGFRWRFGAH